MGNPGRREVVDHRRLQGLEPLLSDIEKSGAARPAQELAAGRREEVAAQGVDIDRHLSDRLAGVEQIGNAVGARDLADLFRGIDQAAVGRDPGGRDERDTLVDHLFQGRKIERAVPVAGHDVDDDAVALGALEKSHVVGGVLRLAGQNPVAPAQG